MIAQLFLSQAIREARQVVQELRDIERSLPERPVQQARLRAVIQRMDSGIRQAEQLRGR